MPALVLSDADKETIKRTVPKPANKIHAVAVARLYIAYPNKQVWVYTGLQGALVLADDLVGNTYWIKLVDISGSNRGVIWDQEIYEPFFYNQDRTFFHSFELEDCLAGLSFVSEKEARQFKKKIDEREKNASKGTKNTPFQGAGEPVNAATSNAKSHSRFGLGSLLGSQRHSSAPSVPPTQSQSIIPPAGPVAIAQKSPNRDRASSLDTVDPSWRGILGELLEMGITEDQIEQNQDFIKMYLEQRNADNGQSNGMAANEGRGKPPPPPSAPPPGRSNAISPQHTGVSTTSKRGPAPAPPQPRRSRQEPSALSVSSSQRTPSPPEEESIPGSQYRFRAPPPLADAGKFAHVTAPSLPRRPRETSVSNPGPPPPPRPPKTPFESADEPKPKFGVPPPFHGERTPNAAPPPPPSREPPSAPITRRDVSANHLVPPASAAPPLPPKGASAPPPPAGGPPLPPARNNAGPPPPPLPSAPRPQQSIAPPPPPLPPPSGGAPPPLPPPMPSSGGGPPPPPLPAGGAPGAAPPLPKPTGDRGDMLAAIKASGGVGGGGLKRVSDKEKRDRSAAMVPGAESSATGSRASAAPSGADGGLQGALQAALSKRNKKVAGSDDEDDKDDDW